MIMSWKLILDDERNFPIVDVPGTHYKLARSYDQAVEFCLSAPTFPIFVSFDHDLGTEKTGYDFAWWLVNEDLNNNGKTLHRYFDWQIHSANIVGAKNISSLMMNYFDHKENILNSRNK